MKANIALVILASPLLVACPSGSLALTQGGNDGDGSDDGSDDDHMSVDDGSDSAGPPEAECVILLETRGSSLCGASTVVTPDGRVLLTGSSGSRSFVWAFDVQGTPLWSHDLGPGFTYSIYPRGDGFAFLHADTGADIVTIDAVGNVVETTGVSEILPSPGKPYDWIETPSGFLVGGVDSSDDLWLAQIDHDGVVETLVSEDYAGFRDYMWRLRRYGDVIGALVNVGSSEYGEIGSDDMNSTLLIEYDEQGVELRRTPVSGDAGESVTWWAEDLDVTADGTWIVSGHKQDYDSSNWGFYAWAAAVRAGEVQWTFESAGTVEVGCCNSASFEAGLAIDDILLVGAMDSTEDDRSWAVRLDSATGDLLSEFVGSPVPGKGYWMRSTNVGIGATSDQRIWLVGMTHHLNDDLTAGWKEHWICPLPP